MWLVEELYQYIVACNTNSLHWSSLEKGLGIINNNYSHNDGHPPPDFLPQGMLTSRTVAMPRDTNTHGHFLGVG